MATILTGKTPEGQWVKVIFGLSFKAYTELPGVNSSRLKHLDHSPAAYHANPMRIGKRPSDVGHMAHTMLLQPELTKTEYVTKPEGMVANKKHKKYQDFLATVPEGAAVVSLKDFELAGDIVESIENDPLCIDHLEGGKTEVTIQWQCCVSGVLCKARIDHIGKNGVTDLKTSKDPTPSGFQYEAKRYGYWKQAAHYQEGVIMAKQAGLLDCKDDYFILAAENTGQLNCQVLYKLNQETIESFNDSRFDELEIVKRCEESGVWPGPGSEAVNALDYPSNAPRAQLDEETDIDPNQGYR